MQKPLSEVSAVSTLSASKTWERRMTPPSQPRQMPEVRKAQMATKTTLNNIAATLGTPAQIGFKFGQDKKIEVAPGHVVHRITIADATGGKFEPLLARHRLELRARLEDLGLRVSDERLKEALRLYMIRRGCGPHFDFADCPPIPPHPAKRPSKKQASTAFFAVRD